MFTDRTKIKMSILKIDEILNVGINKYMQNAGF